MSNRQLSETHHWLFEQGAIEHEKIIIFRQVLSAPEDSTPSMKMVDRLLEFYGIHTFIVQDSGAMNPCIKKTS